MFLATGLLTDGRALALWPLNRDTSRTFLVSDQNVQALYGELLGSHAGRIAIPAGEAHKTVAEAEHVWRALLTAELTRADHVVALGGGVVGDLAGFCAATYQRGIAHVQVPTSLVAQVDSAYGGKTGVDLPDAKNYVGAFHQPSGVMVDPGTLSSLPREELAAGWVEVLKTALIAGGALWESVSSGREVDERMIFACARTKLQVVAADERDGGLRQVLNLGHTVGHAIETSTGYGRYRHGEAVGLGLLAALRLSGQDGLREEVLELLRARGPAGDAVRGSHRRGAGGPLPRQEAAGLRGAVRARGRPGGGQTGLPGARRRGAGGGPGAGRVSTARYRIEVMHGVNLDQLGRRDPRLYGTLTLPQLQEQIEHDAHAHGLAVRFFQTNYEGAFIEHLHSLRGDADAILLNPGSWTHYAWAIRDALEIAALPALEIHLSDIENREQWRRFSVIRDLCFETISGRGPDGYRDALAALREELDGSSA